MPKSKICPRRCYPNLIALLWAIVICRGFQFSALQSTNHKASPLHFRCHVSLLQVRQPLWTSEKNLVVDYDRNEANASKQAISDKSENTSTILKNDNINNYNPTGSIASNFTGNSTQDPEIKTKQSTRTLYDILGASPTDAKSELKRRYIALAKQSHPDATRGLSMTENLDKPIDFSEVAAAYRILSDPKQRKRYDRTLQAEAWSREIQDFAEKFSEQAGPQVQNMIDTVAMPFLRRTTATTLAGIQAAAKDLSESKGGANEIKSNHDLGRTFLNAMAAAQRAGRLVDNLELMEKSEELEKQVLQQIEDANNVKSELEAVIMMRCQLALRTPNATFTSTDATSLLTYWNISNSSRSLLERAMLKNPVDKKIQDLETLEMAVKESAADYKDALAEYQVLESAYNKSQTDMGFAIEAEQWAVKNLAQVKRRVAASKVGVDEAARGLERADIDSRKSSVEYKDSQGNYQRCEKALQEARAESTLSLQSETKARETLTQAKRRLKDSKAFLNDTTKLLKDAKAILEKKALEQERLRKGAIKQQEVVRKAMQKKEAAILGGEGSKRNGDPEWSELRKLEQKAQELTKEYNRLEVLATRTQSRANKLKERAELLKKMD